MAGGLEQRGWGLGRVSKGLGGWGLEGAGGRGGGGGGGGGGGLEPVRTGWDVHLFIGHSNVWTGGRTDENSPLCSIGHYPL